MSRGPLEPARIAIHRAVLRRHIRSVVAGKADRLNIDLADRDVDPSMMLIESAASLDRGGALYSRLEAAASTGSGLAIPSSGPGARASSAHFRWSRLSR